MPNVPVLTSVPDTLEVRADEGYIEIADIVNQEYGRLGVDITVREDFAAFMEAMAEAGRIAFGDCTYETN